MPKEILPREHPVPEGFRNYLLSLDPAALVELEEEVYQAVLRDVTPKGIIEQMEEKGWDREFCTWLVNFTHAQRRPIRAMMPEAYQGEVLKRERRQIGIVTRKWGIATLIGAVVFFLSLIPNLSAVTFLAFLFCLVGGIRFLVGLALMLTSGW